MRQTKKPKLRPWVKIAIAVIVALAIFLIGKGVYTIIQNGNHDYFAGSEYDCQEVLDAQCEEAITDFLNQFYRAQSKLPDPMDYWDYDQEKIDSYVPDMTGFFADPVGNEAKLWQASLRFMITARSLSPLELSLKNIQYNLTYQDIQATDNGVKIKFAESSKFNFKYLGDITSESYMMPCEMELVKDDGWKIVSYYREDDFTLGMSGLFEKTGSVDKAFDKALAMYKKNLKKREKDLENFNKGLVSYDNVKYDVPYDRQSAKEYAAKYVKKRNTDNWDVYDELGGNCQNFGSQVMYAGGIPMDLEGPDIWKYFDSAADNSSAKSGRSYSWTGAPYFNIYAKNNKGKGLVATVDANIYSAEPGDILQVGSSKGHISHTNVVIDVFRVDDQVVDILINSNTNNRINWPIAASLSGNYSLVKIHGYKK
ncbi:MAG: amidase domain-containing protein [Clostridia bacterium]|nr:amidase domain-containing protein [Clostridia bacterium]